MIVFLLGGIHNPTVRVPCDSVRPVRNRRKGHRIKLVPVRETLPRGPALEILDDRPDRMRLVILRLGDILLESFHVAYRNSHALLQRIRLDSVHRIYLRHEHIRNLHERTVA